MTTKSNVKSATKGTAVKVMPAVKVSRKVVELIEDLVEWRATGTEADSRVKELRASVFAVVGKSEQTLTHQNIDVARISRTEKWGVDVEKLKTEFPEIYELVKSPSESFTITAVAKRKSN
jgi:hypothetical protein